MAASMWRMNGLCRSMAGVVLLCALLFSAEVMCQDDGTVPTDAKTSGPVATPTNGPSGAAAENGQSALATDSPADNVTGHQAVDGIQVVVSTAAPAAASDDKTVPAETVPAEVQNSVSMVKEVLPVVKCVEKEAISESSAVKAVVSTDDCDGTKRIIQENPAAWCQMENCNIEIFQEGNMMLVASSDAEPSTLAEALQSKNLKAQLGVTKTETPSSSSSSVFVGILITGLLAAAAIVVGYFKCQRRPDTKGAKLAEDDIENQGNTLASVAPLNPPPETQEKPSVNGESPEADKTQTPPPPTNGHSTAKTADTEL